MERTIEEPKEHVHLETYILKTDRLGRRLLDALSRRAREGVAIRVIYDAVGSRGIDRVWMGSTPDCSMAAAGRALWATFWAEF